MNNVAKGFLVFGLGIIALVLSSYTRTFQLEYIQFPTLIVFFLFCGWLLSLYFKKLLPFPILFLFPTVAILIYAFFINHHGLFHYLGETIMIIPSFFMGFYFLRWSKKIKLLVAILIPVFYIFYISKINPELYYYNNTVRYKSIKAVQDEPIPNFLFIKPDSSSLYLTELKGKVVMIDFYFNNCSPCRKKMPALVRLKNHYKENKDFVLLAVHCGGSESFSEFLAMLNKFPKELNYSYDSSSQAEKHFGMSSYPVEILIDKKGYIREQFGGYSDDVALIYEKKTLKKIDALLNEKN